MKNDLPKRKPNRLKGFDYSASGAYFITICIQNKIQCLSKVVGRGLAPAEIQLTEYGKIAKNNYYLWKKDIAIFVFANM